ncbi:OsrF [Gordoniibacillus kamchatkensis]|uniref:OsrF n=1 Tax=Gordoniibacillus kamchatkensis TaxID=1590651 RepID=A0ABR5ANW9_9BACL|nr:OsrF [Paenibacillus sp. VKM B-2647]
MAEYAVYGGAVLGGGGGGWIEDGLKIARLALEIGQLELTPFDKFAASDLLVTVSMVGAPAAKDRFVMPVHYAKALDLLSQKIGRPIRGLHTNENGAGTTVNGWFQSAITGIPLADFACNGRAHPTGAMGSMNLSEVEGYVSHQAAVGGNEANYVEMSISGPLERAASMIRKASVEAGGLVAVARNPVTADYARQNGAPGAISQAIAVGEALLSHKGEAAIDAAIAKLGGKVVTAGTVTDFTLETSGGFDAGIVRIDGKVEMTFWNEYMTLEKDGERLATFPDLIMTLDAKTARPIVTAAMEKGQQVAVIAVPKRNLLLSTTMYNEKLMKPVEDVINKPVIPYMA